MRSIAEQAVSEFIGTLALVFIGAGSVVVATQGGGAGLVQIALAHGLVLAIMVSSFGHVSGGHFNPAVTISVWVAGKIETARAGVYIVTQRAGAVVGAALLRGVMPEADWRRAHLGATLVNGISNGQAVLLEAILTFFLVIVVFATAIDDRGVFKSVAGLPIGLVLAFDILVGGPFTGASMNPARSFGPALVGGTWTGYWIYVVGPVVGGLVAASIYVFAFLRERRVAAPRTETPIGGGPEENLP
ncbi:MAG: aquaporin [Actinobacteria bacterium]|nr:MAG: aquaporin [Actinomycetota bacterium]